MQTIEEIIDNVDAARARLNMYLAQSEPIETEDQQANQHLAHSYLNLALDLLRSDR